MKGVIAASGVIGAEVWVKISVPGRPRPGPPSDPGGDDCFWVRG